MKEKRLGLWVLTALVVGNMVGSGIFMLPRSLAEVASPAGVLGAWLITGIGVLLTALVFGNLSIRKPSLNGGPQNYALALFKPNTERSLLLGYLVSWGYWVANFAGNVAIITTFASYLSTFFPILTSQRRLFSIGSAAITEGGFITFLVCSMLLWGMHYIILRGVSGAGKLNLAATAAKVLGFALFIVLCLFAFQSSHLTPFAEGRIDQASGHTIGLVGQINHAAVATLWAFIGIESAVVFSTRAKKQSDVKKATIFGLILALILYISITFLVMGTLSKKELLASQKPLVDALSTVIGPSGSYIMALLGMVSLLGATIGWILLSSEVPYQAAKRKMFLPYFAKENGRGTPVFSLTMTNIFTQLFIFSVVSHSMADAYNFVIFVATLAFLVPYVFACLYQVKLVFSGETYENRFSRARFVDGVISIAATIYSAWVIKAGTADLKTFLFGIGMLACGIIFYPIVRKSARK
ncbi:amino acid permease [Fictibacillus sp. Mic-4]|uniref:amino acid permease n=1 Tax=Fictibacillus sp. Mic-4 TaxID=3132826 RepID=UPI003CEB5A9E